LYQCVCQCAKNTNQDNSIINNNINAVVVK
jgi:hypothetical protein